MRLAKVEDLRMRLTATDTGSVMAKLAKYLNSATIYLESYLGSGFAEAPYVDVFYVEPNNAKSVIKVPKLALTSRFVSNVVSISSHETSTAAFNNTDGTDITASCSVNEDLGVVRLLESMVGKFIRVDYTAGFALEEDDTYGDIAPVDYDDVPDWVEECALSLAARLYQAESREMELAKLESSWKEIVAMVDPHRRMHVASFHPIV